METLDVDEFFAQLLVAEGFTNLEEAAYVEIDELLVIDGVDEATADELQTRAREFLEAQARAAMERAQAWRGAAVNFEGLTPQMLQVLAEDRCSNPRRFRHMRRLGTGRRLDDSRRRACEGYRPVGRIRRFIGGSAGFDHDRTCYVGLG